MAEAPIGTADRIETRADLGKPGSDAEVFAYWQAQERIAEKEERKWVKQARAIIKRYRDERPEAQAGLHKFNILWSNVQTMAPALYARTPKPDVQRRFKDADPVARLASILLERCLSYSADVTEFDQAMNAVVEDRLLPGRGVARVLYVPHFGDVIKDDRPEEDGEDEYEAAESDAAIVDSEGDEGEGPETEAHEEQEEIAEADPLREVVSEEVKVRYVFWEDYREGPARQWCEVPWVRYRSYMTRDELIKRFGKKIGKQVSLDYSPGPKGESSKEEPPPDIYKKAVVHEYWDKAKMEVCWIAPGTPDLVLDTKADPLTLPDFFPNPDPLLATTTNDKRIPVPDYHEYQDQARELDNLTARIDVLTKALKVAGVYPGQNKQELQQLLDGGMENRLVPIQDWASFSDIGGLKEIIQWLPIQQVAQTLIQLYDARDRVKAILFEVTGIGDIIRGMSDPRETMGAQQLKASFSTRRVGPQQKDVQRFARDMFRLMAGVIAEHFSPQTISMMTGYPQLDPVPPLPPMPQAPMQMLMGGIGQPQQPMPGPQPGMNGAGPAAGGPMGQPAPPDPQVQQYQQAMAQWQQAKAMVDAINARNMEKQAQFDAAVGLIKNDGISTFRIDIEADSTIMPDEEAEKAARTEFVAQFIPLMQNLVPVAQGNPPIAELAKEITLFAVRGYRVARTMEETIERAFDQIGKMAPNPKVSGQPEKGPQGASPGEIAVQGAEVQAKAAESAGKAQVETLKIMTDAQNKAADRAADMQKHADDVAIDVANLELDAANLEQRRVDSQNRHMASMSRGAERLS